MSKVDKKIKHLVRHFGFKKSEIDEIRKMYEGEEFNFSDPAYLRLLDVSKELCKEYTNVCDLEKAQRRKNKKLKISTLTYLKFYFKKLKLLKKIFPIHGFILYAEDKLDAVIGLVDLKGYGFINRHVTFTPNSLVKIEKSNIFALKITVGDENLAKNDKNLAKLSKISIDKNCWICAGSHICGNVEIGKNSVVGAGAQVENSIPDDSLSVGRPSRVIKKIDKTYKSKNEKAFAFSDDEKEMIRKHITALNFGKYPKEFDKMISGEVFNSMNNETGYLQRLTRSLCNEYSLPETSKARKEEILDILFVGHGKNLKVGNDIHLDMLGTILVGDNVEIGDGVSLGGNLVLESDAKIGNNCVLFASGHSVFAKERKMRFSLKKGFYDDTEYDFIKVEKNVVIGENVVVTPNSIVDKNLPQNSLYVKGKIID